jgi:hypothetical protein
MGFLEDAHAVLKNQLLKEVSAFILSFLRGGAYES